MSLKFGFSYMSARHRVKSAFQRHVGMLYVVLSDYAPDAYRYAAIIPLQHQGSLG
jgi:hypothetical protein